MSRMFTVVAMAGVAAGLAGCAMDGSARVVQPAGEEQLAMFDRVKAMEGTWTFPVDESGAQGTSTFEVSSAGSVVVETMFPGEEHEMTNVYHMDGPDLVVTHYCAVGNQPRMRARGMEGDAIHFRFDGVTNLQPTHQGYMGEMSLVFQDEDHVEQRWTHFTNGQPGEPFGFVMTRRR